MKNLDYLAKILCSVLSSLYQIAGFAAVMAILFMGCFLLAKEHGWKETAKRWWLSFRKDKQFRRMFFLTFYTAMILFRTLFNRSLWFRPLEHIIGVWGLYDANGQFTTEVIENLLLFIPFTTLYMWVFRNTIFKDRILFLKVIWKAIWITFLFSLTIELLQLFLRVGTFQLSDLFYNTLGGFVGGLIYWIGHQITEKRNSREIKEFHDE